MLQNMIIAHQSSCFAFASVKQGSELIQKISPPQASVIASEGCQSETQEKSVGSF